MESRGDLIFKTENGHSYKLTGNCVVVITKERVKASKLSFFIQFLNEAILRICILVDMHALKH